MRAANSAYESLLTHVRQMALVASTQELLAWDELTHLPDEATEYRGQQLAHLAGIHHALAIDPRLDDWLAAIDGSPLVADVAGAAAVNVRELRRQRVRHTRLPLRLIDELVRVTTAAQHDWKIARDKNDFRHLQPALARVIRLKQEEAQCLADGPELYDPLLAEYEPELTTADIRTLFARLAAELTSLLPTLIAPSSNAHCPVPSLLQGRFPQARQHALCEALSRELGFDFSRGRLDVAVHPFTSHLGPHDCRLAIRYDESNLRESLYALLHELGHGLYDQGLPTVQYGTPAGEAASLSAHEALARLWENMVGRSLGFWQWLLPRVQAAFPGELNGTSPAAIHQEVNRAERGVNRVAAGEVTYNLHILLRFELEQALISGSLPIADLPAAWNERHQQLLGIAPATDRAGVLQDGHWPAGMFGYFPTYTIGNVLAAQLFDVAQRDLGDLDQQFASGQFQPLREWLAAGIFRHGKRFTTRGLAQAVCGTELDPTPLLSRLRATGMVPD